MTCGEDKFIKVWDADDGRCLMSISSRFEATMCLFHPINNNMIIVNLEETIRLYNFSFGKLIVKLPVRHEATAIAVSNCGQYIFGGTEAGDLYVFKCTNFPLYTEYKKVCKYTATSDHDAAVTWISVREEHTEKYSQLSVLVGCKDSLVRLLK